MKVAFYLTVAIQWWNNTCTVQNKIPAIFFSFSDKLKVKRVSIALIFNRRSGNYIVHIYIPSLSLVMLSWLSFLMSPTDIANRLALVTTMLVSMVFLHSEMNTSLPPVSYAKASDWFVLVSFGFILLTLLESSLVYRTSTSKSRMTRMVVGLSLLFWFPLAVTQDELELGACVLPPREIKSSLARKLHFLCPGK